MSINLVQYTEPAGSIGLNDALTEVRWYAAYTCAHHEKKIDSELRRREVESFLPLYKSVRRWSDRQRIVTLPLFPGYIFVRIHLHERLRVLQIPGVVSLVGFGGLPMPLPDEQMEVLCRGWNEKLNGEPCPYLKIGRRVRIVRGPLAGAEGVLTRKKGALRVVLSVEAILRSISVEIEATNIEAA